MSIYIPLYSLILHEVTTTQRILEDRPSQSHSFTRSSRCCVVFYFIYAQLCSFVYSQGVAVCEKNNGAQGFGDWAIHKHRQERAPQQAKTGTGVRITHSNQHADAKINLKQILFTNLKVSEPL